MKVYLLYSDKEVQGVFSSPQKAQAYAVKHLSWKSDSDEEVFITTEVIDPEEEKD